MDQPGQSMSQESDGADDNPLMPPLEGLEKHYDVVIVSGSSAGVGAALGAGRMGARVALIEDTSVLGGMLANGICNIDTYSLESLSGVFEEFRQAVIEHYRPSFDTDPLFSGAHAMLDHLDGRSGQANPPRHGGRWEPHVADEIFKRLVADVPSVDVYYNRFATDVIKDGQRVVGVLTEESVGPHAYGEKVEGRQLVFLGDVFIDATHEGDVAAWAGAPYRVGREARSRLEPHAGDITFFNGTGEIIGGTGRQDRAIVSAGIRLTTQINSHGNNPHNGSEPPRGYDPANYEHAPAAAMFTVPMLPNGKAEINANPIGNELQEPAWDWPEATREERRRLYDVFRDHALGFLYHLQTVEEAQQVRLAPDEYTENSNVPYRVFVRESRRIVGEETMTEADVNPFILSNGLLPPLRRDSVGVGHYAIDSKPVRSKTDLATPDKGPGDVFLHNGSTAFQVPYRALVPKDVDGILVPTALSATHVAFSAVRMDPTWTVLGQAAGVAAVLSIRDGVPVRNVNVDVLQRELIAQRVKVAFYWDLSALHPAFLAVQWLSVRGVVSGYPDRTFRPDEPLTRAHLAEFLFRGLDLWPSVSEEHFTDLPFDHWAFRYLETLFDNRALEPFGVKPLWHEHGPYDAAKHAWFDNRQHHPFGQIRPDEPVSWDQALGVLDALGKAGKGLAGKSIHSGHATVTRGEFCALLAELIESPSHVGDSARRP